MLSNIRKKLRRQLTSAKPRRSAVSRRLRAEQLEERKLFAVALLNEIGIDLPGTDNPFEYIEIKGIPGSTLQNVYFASIEGDGPPATGLADFVVDLSGQTFGSNGLIVIKANAGGYTPAAETTVVGVATLASGGPLENGTVSNLLIHSPTTPITQATDYDSDNDGNLTNNPSTNLPADAVILDSVGWSDGGGTDRVYGTSLGTQTNRGVAVRFLDDNRSNLAASWYWGSLTGSQGSTIFGAAVSPNFPSGGAATPGSINVPGTNIAPVAVADSFSVGQSETLVVTVGSGVLSNDTDANGLNQLLFAELVTGPTNASTFSLGENGSFTYVNNGTLGADSFTYRATDLQEFSSIVTVSINVAVNNNTPPVLTVPAEVVAFVENAAPVTVSPTGTITDTDSVDFGNGNLTAQVIINASSDDRLSIRNQGTAAGEIGNNSGVITYGGVTIGSATGGIGGAALTVSLNGSASLAAVQALLRNVTFANISDAPSILDRVVQFQVTDGDGGPSSGLSNTQTQTVTVTAVNDAPSLSATRTSFSYAASSGTAVTLDGSMVVTDVDSIDFNTGVLTASITSNGIAAADSLIVRNIGNAAGQVGVSGSTVSFGGVAVGAVAGGINGTSLTVTFNTSATQAAVQAVARAVAFQTTSTRMAPLAKTVTVSLTDGDGGSSNSLAYSATQSQVRNFVFQEGVDAGQGLYVGAGDVQLFQPQPDTNIPAGTQPTTEGLLVDYDAATSNSAVLLKYDNLIGTGPGQIPANAKILSARLILTTLNPGDGATIHRMITSWDPGTATWNSIPASGSPLIRNDGTIARAAWDSQVGGPGGGGDTAAGLTTIGVAADIQAWVNGETNNGWLFQGHNGQADGWGFTASEASNPAARPRLEIEWVPASMPLASFQQGVNNYSGTVDTSLTSATPDTDNSASTGAMFVDFTDAAANPQNNSHVVMRFDNINGTSVDQVPAGALIHGAYLTFSSIDNNGAGDGGQFYPLLQAWPSIPTWNGFVGGIQNDGVEAAVNPTIVAGNSTLFPNVEGGWNDFNVTQDVQNWTNGVVSNNGWGIVPWNLGTDGWGIKSSESADVRTRPRLQVAYTPVGVSVSPASGLTTTEAGGTASFSVVLNTPPTADVTIGLSSSDTSEGTISVTQLVFTPANWDIPQTVLVTGVDDADIDGNVAYQIITAAATSTDVNYNGLVVADVALVNNDNDTTMTTSAVTQKTSSVSVQFNKAFDPLKLNIVDSNNVNGAADVTLVGNTVGAVKGSVILDADNKGFTFIKTGGPLEADTYTLTLRSATNGFTDAAGNLLDGDGNNVAGGDFVQQFTVTAPASGAITLRVGDFVRGYGQAVNLPANTTSGLPITISTGVNVTGASFTVNYNPALLTITGGTTSIAGANVTVNTSVAGQAVVNVTSSAQFSATAGLLALVNLTAVIPDTAPNGSKGVISLSGVTLTSADASPLVSTTDDGYLIASYKGDVNNNRTINTGDVTGLLRSVSGALSTTGFPSLKLADPVLVGDMNDSTTLTSGDVTGLLRFISGANGGFPAIPALPAGITPPAPGADPQVFVPQNLVATPGSTVVVPININVTEPTGASVAGIDVSFTYDTSRFTFASVATGSALSGFTFSSSNNTATPGFARLVFATDFGPAFANGFVGTLLNVTLNVLPGAASGASAVNLTAVGLSDNDTNDLLISPPVTPGVDSSDGIITIPGAGNSAPTDIGLSAASIAENAGANATVGTLSTTDPNAGDSFTYTLVSGTGSEDNAAFNISGSTLRATASLDFEAKPSYNVRVRSTDGGGLFFEKAFVISATNVNETPVFNPSSYSFTIAENSAASTAVGTVTATDPDAATTLTYSLSGTGASNFVINASTGAITVAAGATLNFEGTNTWNLTATASDGTLSTTAPVVISLTNVNESPVFSPSSYSFSIAENSAASTAVGTVTATDPDASTTLTYSLEGVGASNFTINPSTGAITVAAGAVLNFEGTTSFSLNASVSDGTLSSTAAVTIEVTNVNEAPVFAPASYSFSLAENSASGTAVGAVTATDPDAATTLAYSLSGTGASNFVINASTGAITVAAGATLDFEVTNTWNLTATVSDGSLTATAPVVISLTNVNETPVFSPSSYSFSIAENSAASTAVGTVIATDPDAATTLTYSLSGTGASNFVINASTGAITVAAGATLNFEGTNTWNLTATASDGTLSTTAPVVISLTNVNEAPVFTSGNAFTLSEANTIGIQGPQSSATPYLTSRDSNVQFSSILTVGDAVSGYRMVGIPDGMGAYDNGDGTFTLLMNHELNNTVGIARAHGQPGAFVSKWIINKSTLQVVSIEDFLRNGSSVFLSNNDPTTSVSHTAYLAAATTLISRLCSADLAAPTAYQWTDVSTGTTFGTSARIFQSGEESGGSVASPFGPEANILFGRQFAFVATDDPNTTTINEAGTAWELPHAGLFSWENNVANPLPQRKTVVVGLDDSTGGQIYVWVGNKQTTGNVVERAGLTKQGAEDNMFVVKVAGLTADASGATNETRATPLSGTFTLENEGDVSGLTLAGLETLSDIKGATQFFRPEDGQFDPANPNDFYFLTTDQYDQAKDGIGSQIGRSRLYRLRFTDITNPTTGGTITAVLDGTESGNMFDNMTISNGKAILQEDVGNQAHLGKIWSYDLATDTLTEIAQHDRTRFGDVGIAATAPFSQDEESSGVIDVSSILGAGTYLLNVQAHYNIGDPELVEGGQLLMMRTNVTTGQSLVTTVTANDAESSALTYSISGGADQADFVIDPATGRLSFAVAPNFESPADANTDNVYQVQVSVSDGVNAAVTQDIQVTVTAVNETPTNTTLTSVAVAENSTAVTTATGTDPEGASLSYAISGGADAARFAINASGALSFITAPDFESPTDNGANNSYFVTVTVSDGVTAPVNKTVVVTLTNVNETPVFSPSSYSFSIAENSAASTAVGTVTATDPDASTTLTYSLSGTGASNFVINSSTGAITVAAGATLNFEGTNTWNLTATASDGTLSTTAPVVISLTNVNESPVFSPSSYSFSIAENSAASTAVGTVIATDPDASTTLTYSLSGTGASNFVINASTGAITVAAGASFNAATTPTYTLTATASDGSLSTTASVTVSVTAAAPSLVSVAVNGGDTFKNPAQRSEITSLVIGFSAPVVVSAGAFTIANVGLVNSQTPVELAQSQILVTADASQMVYTIRFAPGAGVVSRSGAAGTGRGNSLADGNFVLSIDPTKVTRSGVNLSASNTLGDGDNQFGDLATDDFFRMFGDGNGDGVVSTTDTGGFRASLSAYDAAFDADGDGVVLNSGVDRTDFLSNFGKRRRR